MISQRIGRKIKRGFGLIELMVVVAILTILSLLAIRAWGQGRQREELLKVGSQLVNILREIQAEARVFGEFRAICFKQDFATGQYFVQSYKPDLGGGSTLPSDNNCLGNELSTGKKFPFGASVKLCTTCDSKIDLNTSLFFDKDGFATSYNGNRSTYEICISNPNLPIGTAAREIEVGVNGDIHLIAQSQSGNYSGVVANQGSCL
ncbi:MAG: prepilin-type N-terminal cleavage/methylation domain-containing protein [Bdellovibrionales bacterium]|nr:prepilin-type N-terminal cleavage/methylation domain-containing protein [Bdellovibrionales bacterium]